MANIVKKTESLVYIIIMYLHRKHEPALYSSRYNTKYLIFIKKILNGTTSAKKLTYTKFKFLK